MTEHLNSMFVLYQESFELKELGFDEPCFGLFTRSNNELLVREMPNQGECELYYGGILAPVYAQVFRWFRDEFELDCTILRLPEKEVTLDSPKGYACYVSINLKKAAHFKNCDTYLEAELTCIRKLIEIVKNK